jgi:hypothetical protein
MPFQGIFQNTLFHILVTFLHNRNGFLHYEMPYIYICMKYDFPFYLIFFILNLISYKRKINLRETESVFLVPWKMKIELERQKVLFWYLGKGKSNLERQKVLYWYLGKGKSYFERQKVLFWYLGKGKSCFIILKSAFMSSFIVKIQFDSVEN